MEKEAMELTIVLLSGGLGITLIFIGAVFITLNAITDRHSDRHYNRRYF